MSTYLLVTGWLWDTCTGIVSEMLCTPNLILQSQWNRSQCCSRRCIRKVSSLVYPFCSILKAKNSSSIQTYLQKVWCNRVFCCHAKKEQFSVPMSIIKMQHLHILCVFLSSQSVRAKHTLESQLTSIRFGILWEHTCVCPYLLMGRRLMSVLFITMLQAPADLWELIIHRCLSKGLFSAIATCTCISS